MPTACKSACSTATALRGIGLVGGDTEGVSRETIPEELKRGTMIIFGPIPVIVLASVLAGILTGRGGQRMYDEHTRRQDQDDF